MTRFAQFAVSLLLAAGPAPDAPIAEVNGRVLTARDLDAYLAVRGVPSSASAALRERAAMELVDRELIRGFLARHKVEPDAEQLALAVRRAKERLAAEGGKPEEVLASLGIDEARLEAEVALPLAWRKLAAQALTDEQIRKHFDEHRRRLDGTRLRVAQIFLKYEPGESATDAPKTTDRLSAVRDQIIAGKTTFTAAAKAHSQSPTAARGGEVGWIGPRGDLPEPVAAAAYALKEGGVSDVVTSRIGAHLVTVLEVEPGDLSLEDARPAIVEELSRRLWEQTVAAERKTAKITQGAKP